VYILDIYTFILFESEILLNESVFRNYTIENTKTSSKNEELRKPYLTIND